MSRTSSRPVAATLVAVLLVLMSPLAVGAQSPAPKPSRGSSTAKRIVWTVIGAGIGFGTGLLLGVQRFDDAIYAERKIWTTALTGAAVGGVAGALLSRGRRTAAADDAKRRDPLWQGIAAGAAAGAAIGMVYIPLKECKPENPDCPWKLAVGVGIPLAAAGAAIGAGIDRLIR